MRRSQACAPYMPTLSAFGAGSLLIKLNEPTALRYESHQVASTTLELASPESRVIPLAYRSNSEFAIKFQLTEPEKFDISRVV